MFYIFQIIYNMYVRKEHLTIKGFLLCLSYINVLNNPINVKVLAEITSKLGRLPLLILPPVCCHTSHNLDPNWIVGFRAGEGSFTYFMRTRLNALKQTVLDYTLIFEVSQLPLDYYLMYSILNHIGFGNAYMQNTKAMRIRFTTSSVLQHYILPFFTNILFQLVHSNPNNTIFGQKQY